MKAECLNCNSTEIKKVLNSNDGSDNIDGLAHHHLECQQCGNQFNLWDCTIDMIKKIFGDSWKTYA